MKTVTLIPASPLATSNYYNALDNTLQIKGKVSYSSIDECVVMQSSCYYSIFHEKKKNRKAKLSVVKITANGRSIYRSYTSGPIAGFDSDMIGLSTESLRYLSDNGVLPSEVAVSKGCSLFYYFNHPDHSIRIAFKLGLLSIVIALVSLFISII